MFPKISVVVRTRNTESHFDCLLKNLASQTLPTSEIVVADNYSTEESLRFLERKLMEIGRKHFKSQKIKLIPISDREFSHAYSTNLAVKAAENELVCITNAHSIPISDSWLQDGSRHFEDPKVAGVSGFFFPHTKGNVLGTVNARAYFFSQKMLLHLDWCSTINCIIRKSLWKEYPFDENLPRVIPETGRYGAEDYDWSREMESRGFRIVVDPLFSIFHSHCKGLDETRRNIRNYFIYRRVQQKIDSLNRPRRSFSRVFEVGQAESTIVLLG